VIKGHKKHELRRCQNIVWRTGDCSACCKALR